jgi:DNA helicase-2/ATP-dependent DNA helicase PcrA
MITPKFQTSYKRLNSEQKEAVDLIEGPVMVIAGPGTGKTQILTLRIANILLKTQVNPSNILALTFTEAAAAEMRHRLVEMIGTDGYKVEINTFHGFCNDVIKNYPEAFSHMISSEPITEVEQIQFMEELILKTELQYLRPFGDPLYYVRSVLSEINNLKKEAVNPADLELAIEQQKKDFDVIEDLYHDKGRYKGEMKGKYQDLKKEIVKNEELNTLYKSYQNFLEQEKFYDFNDMLFEVKDMMESDKSFLLTLQEKYQYILVDEHQDTNALQNRIVQLLGDFFDEPNIFVVAAPNRKGDAHTCPIARRT